MQVIKPSKSDQIAIGFTRSRTTDLIELLERTKPKHVSARSGDKYGSESVFEFDSLEDVKTNLALFQTPLEVTVDGVVIVIGRSGTFIKNTESNEPLAENLSAELSKFKINRHLTDETWLQRTVLFMLIALQTLMLDWLTNLPFWLCLALVVIVTFSLWVKTAWHLSQSVLYHNPRETFYSRHREAIFASVITAVLIAIITNPVTVISFFKQSLGIDQSTQIEGEGQQEN